MALGRLFREVFEGIGPFFRDTFGGLGEAILDFVPQAIFQLLVDELGFGPVMIGVLAIVLVLILLTLGIRLAGSKKRRARRDG